jgi:hypothetical protein
MSSFRSFTLAASVLLAAAVPTAAPAQDFNARPNYGTVELRTGFEPDPHVTQVQSGGNLDASRIASNCAGFITSAPDLRLVFDAGTLPLIISVASRSDTTLVVNGPDGRWYCDDDGGANGLNPALRFNHPVSGRYEIWVGTYGHAALQDARLNISELTSQ